MSTVASRLSEIKARVTFAAERAGRKPDDVTLVAVSKKQPIEKLKEAYDAGQRIFGENYVQALSTRASELPKDAVWHLIGHVQTNKAKRAAEIASLIHSVDSLKLAEMLSRAGETLGRKVPVLVEVNVSDESTKSGVNPDEAFELLESMFELSGLEVHGLMCIPAPGPDVRRAFAKLRTLRDRLEFELSQPLWDLSMGMSDDFEDAISEGATIVRIGTAIFGARQ